MKKILFIGVLLIFNLSFCQKNEIDVGTYKLEIKKIKFTSTTIAELGAEINIAPNNHKFLVVTGIFIPKFKKNNSININDFTFKSQNEEFTFVHASRLSIDMHLERGSNIVKVRRPRKNKIVVTLPKNTSSGGIFYKGEKIGTIKFSKNGKKIEFLKV